jgi:hypothetical protein
MVMVSVTAPLNENSRWQASIIGRYPPHCNEGGKKVDTLDGGDDIEGGLGVGGEPLLA